MKRQINATRRLSWRRVVPALLLSACWMGIVIVGNVRRGERSSTPRLASDGNQPGVRSDSIGAPTNGLGVSRYSPARAATAPATTVTVDVPAPSSNPPSIRFNGHPFSPDSIAPAALAEFQRRLGEGSNAVVLIGLATKPGRTVRKDLAARGIDLIDYVADDGWIARIHGARQPLVEPRLFFFQPLDASLRIQSGLPERALVQADVPVYVHTMRDRPITRLVEALMSGGFPPMTALLVGDRTHLAGTIPASRLPEFLRLVAAHPDTLWVEAGRRARLLNADASRVTQGGSPDGNTPFFERGIFGAGQVIAVCDTGLDVDSCFFRNAGEMLPPANRLDGRNVDPEGRKVIAADFLDLTDDPGEPLDWDNHGHGTAVAGTAAGSSLYDPWNPDADNGMAPGAKLLIQDAGFRPLDDCAELPGLGCPVTNFYPALRQAVAQGATIHNNSWGDLDDTLQPNVYSETCRELDLITWSNKQFLVVCAAGNNFFDDSVSSPSTAKNGLSVAASFSVAGEGRIAGYSSRGWASDGRIKPDLAAPGQNLRTAASDGDITTENCYRTSRSGTSFAAPVVAGLAALVRDYFAQGYYPAGIPAASRRWTNPSAALVKAVLINAATPLSGAAAPAPSRDQGWGQVNLSQTLRLSPAAPALLALDQSPGFAESPAFPFKIYLRLTATNHPLRVTLVWSDYPATPGADRHLVNDLDLRVSTPSFAMKGNQLRGGRSVAGGEYDRRNNVERVECTPDQPAIVEISVWAHRIVVGPQDFALVATGDFEAIAPDQDDDHDGLPDAWELWQFGSLAPRPGDDPDGDGATNEAEFAANTDPTRSESLARLEILSCDSNGVTLAMAVGEDRQYVLERRCDGLPGGPWLEVSEPMFLADPCVSATLLFTDPAHPQKAGARGSFYRVRIDPIPLNQ